MAENYVASVAAQQFTKKVEKKVMPLAYANAPEPTDFVGGMRAGPENGDDLFALSVLEGEEAFLMQLQHQGSRDKLGKDPKVTRAAASKVSRKVATAKKAKTGLPEGGQPSQESVEGAEGAAGEASAVDASLAESAKAKPRKGPHWLDKSPLLPGGASSVPAKKGKGKAGGQPLGMYLLPGTGGGRSSKEQSRGGGQHPGHVCTEGARRGGRGTRHVVWGRRRGHV